MGNYKKKGYRQQRVCECGEKFLGGSTAKYCYECKAKKKREQHNVSQSKMRRATSTS